MNPVWRGMADAVVAVHYGFLLYLLTGGFIAWRWPKTIVTHLAAAVWAALIVTTSVACPLTFLQNEFRALSGESRLQGGFISLYVKGTFYPASEQTLTQALVGVIVLGSWIGLLMRRRNHSAGLVIGGV